MGEAGAEPVADGRLLGMWGNVHCCQHCKLLPELWRKDGQEGQRMNRLIDADALVVLRKV